MHLATNKRKPNHFLSFHSTILSVLTLIFTFVNLWSQDGCPTSRFKPMLKAKKPENRKGQLLSQKDRTFTESLSVLFTFILLTKCTVWIFLGQGVSASALMTVWLDNSLLGGLSCALQMSTSSPGLYPPHP